RAPPRAALDAAVDLEIEDAVVLDRDIVRARADLLEEPQPAGDDRDRDERDPEHRLGDAALLLGLLDARDFLFLRVDLARHRRVLRERRELLPVRDGVGLPGELVA